MLIPIDDLEDARLDEYRTIPDPELLRTRGVFVAEGRAVVRRLLASRFVTRSLLLTPAARDALADLLDTAAPLPVYVVSPRLMNAVTGFNIHRGCLAIGERPPAPRWQTLAAASARAVVLEGVANADNVGGIFRSAAAFAADAVLLGPACADPLYRKAIRTSMGAALRVPFAALDDWPADLAALKRHGFTLLALTPDPAATPLHRLHDTSPGDAALAKVAVIVGHEGDGLSAGAMDAADYRVRIPMADGIDSLNVATATSIALYELSRR